MSEYIFTKKGKNGTPEKVGSLTLHKTEDVAKLYFYGDICSATWQSEWYPEDKAPQDIVDFLAEVEGVSKLEVYINSGGGAVYGGLAIYNILSRFQAEKVAYIDGIAASIASVIPFACDRVVANSGSQMMIHKPWSYIVGNADDMRKEAESLDICQESIISVYMKHVREGVTVEQLTEMVNRETWLTGEQAAEVFEIEVAQGATAVAAMSGYYNTYKKPPKTQEPQPHQAEQNRKRRLQLELDTLTL